MKVKAPVFYDNKDWFSDDAQTPYMIMDTQEIKTTWHPIENIGGSSSKY